MGRIMFYPSHSIRSMKMKEDKLFLKFNFQHPLIPKFIELFLQPFLSYNSDDIRREGKGRPACQGCSGSKTTWGRAEGIYSRTSLVTDQGGHSSLLGSILLP